LATRDGDEIRSESEAVPMEQGLAEVLTSWRAECAYNPPEDYVFGSIKLQGKQPIWPKKRNAESHPCSEASRD